MFLNQNEARIIHNKPVLHQQTDYNLINDYALINQYLNLDFEHSNQSSQLQFSAKKQTQNIMNTVPNQFDSSALSFHQQKKQKSPYHNFQKHLITVIKKFINFSKNKLSENTYGEVSYSIWHVFVKSNICNKKILCLVFGTQVQNINFNNQSSKQFKVFQDIFNQYSREEIQQAQRLLRNCVVTQAKTLSKCFLNSNSKVCKFEEFYLYFRGFISELQNGPLSFRTSNPSRGKISQINRQIISE